MTHRASASYSLAIPMPDVDTLEKFRALLAPHAEKPLVFIFGGRAIAAGYHVTEVKAGRFASIDCGANPETWSETIVQLWDVERDDETHMPVRKFLGILAQVGRRVAVDDDALLIFEAGNSVDPMQVFTVGDVRPFTDRVEIMLAPRPATCKPRERGLEAVAAKSQACCKPANAGSGCCT